MSKKKRKKKWKLWKIGTVLGVSWGIFSTFYFGMSSVGWSWKCNLYDWIFAFPLCSAITILPKNFFGYGSENIFLVIPPIVVFGFFIGVSIGYVIDKVRK